MSPLDLHVLGTPPAFVLSQDQTLPFNPSSLSLLPPASRIPAGPPPGFPRVLNSLGIFAVFFLLNGLPAIRLRVSSLYRFQGSTRFPSRSPARVSLNRISKFGSFVKHFFRNLKENYASRLDFPCFPAVSISGKLLPEFLPYLVDKEDLP